MLLDFLYFLSSSCLLTIARGCGGAKMWSKSDDVDCNVNQIKLNVPRPKLEMAIVQAEDKKSLSPKERVCYEIPKTSNEPDRNNFEGSIKKRTN